MRERCETNETVKARNGVISKIDIKRSESETTEPSSHSRTSDAEQRKANKSESVRAEVRHLFVGDLWSQRQQACRVQERLMKRSDHSDGLRVHWQQAGVLED